MSKRIELSETKVKRAIELVLKRREPRRREGMNGGCNLDDEEKFAEDLLKELGMK